MSWIGAMIFDVHLLQQAAARRHWYARAIPIIMAVVPASSAGSLGVVDFSI